jgi:LmbE family N-acetylglucosaminyl deacetylase
MEKFILDRRQFLRGVTLATATAVGVPFLLSPAEQALAEPGGAVNLDILYIGAHPDDEAGTLATLGQWNEYHGMTAGVITVTRGEGGGNAIGLEEGPPLGLIREAEERRAVGYAGVENVYNLDGLDFYYTASAPLSSQIWGHASTLSRIVRVIRATRPSVIITMNPSATEGNHGNHQQAAMLAVEAFYAAADPEAFPEQIRDEGFQPWRVARILRHGAVGRGGLGPDAVKAGYVPTEPTETVFGTWDGPASQKHGELWNTVKTWAQWEYKSQGWHTFPPATTDPARIGSQWYTLIDSRTPYPAPTTGGTAALQGAALQADGGLPLGTELYLTSAFDVLAGVPFEVTAHVRASREALTHPVIEITVPDGWSVSGDGTLGVVEPHRPAEARFTITPKASAETGEWFRIDATLSTLNSGRGSNSSIVQTVAPVRGTLEPLPEIAEFRRWTADNDVEQLANLIAPVLTMGSGRTRSVRIDLANNSDRPQSGTVRLRVPDGFAVEEPEQPYAGLAAGGRGKVTFVVTNTDTSLPTSNRAPNNGNYPIEIETTFDGESATEAAALQLVPVVVVPKTAIPPTIDGVFSTGEYPGDPIDISTIWEGDQAPPADISGKAWLTYTDEALYVFLDVTDDVLGIVLPPADAKRQRRTDSVEIAIDPRGNSANTSTVFNVGIFPTTDAPDNDNPPSFHRDRDNYQGPGLETAPGMVVAAVVKSPYAGYTIEAKMPFAVLPDTIDPQHMGFNILVNDSDTQDKTTQTRVGWSTWRGVRADPYRWGIAVLQDYPAKPSAPKEPILPDTAARSINSPQSILQSAQDEVPLGGWPGLPAGSVRILSTVTQNGAIAVRLRSRYAGTARVFAWDGEQVLGRIEKQLGAGTHTLSVPLAPDSPEAPTPPWLLVSYECNGSAAAAARQTQR